MRTYAQHKYGNYYQLEYQVTENNLKIYSVVGESVLMESIFEYASKHINFDVIQCPIVFDKYIVIDMEEQYYMATFMSNIKNGLILYAKYKSPMTEQEIEKWFS